MQTLSCYPAWNYKITTYDMFFLSGARAILWFQLIFIPECVPAKSADLADFQPAISSQPCGQPESLWPLGVVISVVDVG